MEIDYKGLKLTISFDFVKKSDESIVLLHGLGCSKDTFRDIWNFPQFEESSILTFDFVGFADSSKPENFSYSMEDQAEVCRLIIEKLDLKNINLVGHSMGGAIGLLLIEKIPDRVISFINLEGNLIGEDCDMSGKVTKISYEEFKKSLFEKINNQTKELNETGAELRYEWSRKSYPYGFYQSSKSLVKWSDSSRLLDLFMKLKIKKVYIYGDRNSGKPGLKRIKDRVKTISIPNSRHFMMMDNPEEFYKILAQILRQP